jgi:integrase
MARHIHRLSDVKIRTLRKKGLHADGLGLYLKVTESGSKSWILRFAMGGKRRDMGLGVYPSISLAGARELAKDAHTAIQRGIDPVDFRRDRVAGTRSETKVTTFGEAGRRYMDAHEAGWKNEKHRWQWKQTLEDVAGPILGEMSVAAINTNHVLKVLEPIWHKKPETATRLRGRIEAVLDWCKARGLCSGENPARWRGHLDKLLPARAKFRKVKHHAALPWREIPEFMRELRAVQSISARALEFTILTAARTGETIGATSQEIDQRAATWTIPPERMKAGVEHRVPLTAAALATLDAVPRFEGNPYLFPGGRRGQGFSNMAMLKLLREMRPGMTVHGFRSSFRDWVAEMTSFPRELAEVALAHIVGNAVERAYQRGDLFEKRRKLMEAWADFCERGVTSAEVVRLHAHA